MKAAEWRKRLAERNLYGRSDVPEALLRDLEAAEAEARHNSDGWNGALKVAAKYMDRAKAAEKRVAALLEDAHRLEERCVAAEEERNAAQGELAVVDGLLARRFALDDCPQRYDKIAKAIDYAKRTESAEARAQAEQRRREAAEARVLELQAALKLMFDAYPHLSDKAYTAAGMALHAWPQEGASRE